MEKQKKAIKELSDVQKAQDDLIVQQKSDIKYLEEEADDRTLLEIIGAILLILL